jgi:hypothetical protein
MPLWRLHRRKLFDVRWCAVRGIGIPSSASRTARDGALPSPHRSVHYEWVRAVRLSCRVTAGCGRVGVLACPLTGSQARSPPPYPHNLPSLIPHPCAVTSTALHARFVEGLPR